MPNYSVSVLRNNEMLEDTKRAAERARTLWTVDNININSDEELGKNNIIRTSSNKISNNNANPFYLSSFAPSLSNFSDFSHKI